jgi:hypothetical protein
MVAWRSSRAEARKAVAVRAASETRANTLMRAKLGEVCVFEEDVRKLFISESGHVNPEFIGP